VLGLGTGLNHCRANRFGKLFDRRHINFGLAIALIGHNHFGHSIIGILGNVTPPTKLEIVERILESTTVRSYAMKCEWVEKSS
jgi:hypothetical protein